MGLIDDEDIKKMRESKLTKEEYHKKQLEDEKRDHPEDFEKLETYLTPEFKKYAQEKYITDAPEEIFTNK